MLSQEPKIIIISADELQQKMIKDPDLTIINILSDEKFHDCHIPGSRHIPYEKIVEITSSWDKDKPVVIYCDNNNCRKSSLAAQTMHTMGFKFIYDFADGLKAWMKKNYPTTGPCTTIKEDE